MSERPKKRGGAREGAGRPSQGKVRLNVSLNSGLVERAKERENNLSGLLDRLLERWLAEKA